MRIGGKTTRRAPISIHGRKSSIPATLLRQRHRADWQQWSRRYSPSYGLPNGYVLGEEGSGALIGGLTYGEGILYTKNAGDHKVFWQGPSLGWDFGGNGDRMMMLVYNLPMRFMAGSVRGGGGARR